MKYGFIGSVDTNDAGGYYVRVSVDFMVYRSDVYRFVDCLMPVDLDDPREPIEAILEHSCGRKVER